MAGKDAFGSQFLRDSTGSGSFVLVANVTDISGPSRSREAIEVTAHDSPNRYREFIKGLKDGGEVELTINYDPGNSTHTALDADFEEDDLRDYQVVILPGEADEHTWAFSALITDLGDEYPTEGQMERTATFKIDLVLPVVVPIAVVAELWRIMYHPTEDGMLNSLLGLVGFGPSGFINDPDTSMVSIMLTGIWRGAPYDMMIFLAGLAGVDRGLYEAAKVDGASRLQRIRHVTVPGLRAVLTILFILAAIRGLRVFTEVFLLTNGGPDGSTEVVMTVIYKLGLEQNRLGVGAAGAVLLFLATLLLTVGVHLFRRRGNE